ncbi:MAG: MotA/TolQ/ExbB proton channel family protein [Rhodospirillaceae bacterium]|nr:MotA/TolQ/ExbB proton channel family protein [Rhodospirillaceae bacterium]
MTSPSRYLIRMTLFLAVVAAGAVLVASPLRTAFMANAPLNGLIVGVFLLGAINSFRQVLQLGPELEWIEHFRSGASRPSADSSPTPALLSPMAAMLGDRSEIKISSIAMRSLLDGVASRLDEQREISRYTVGLLVFLGLLGTFWGLLDTLGAIRDVISNISVGGGNISAVFDELKSGLEKPLTGMGTAFSSSLFGLAGSLVLGFLDLQTGQAHNRFYTELEDWLSGQARLSSGGVTTEGDHGVPAYVEALLEQTAESLENLQRTLARGEENRHQTHETLSELAARMGTLTDFMQTEQAVLKKLAETQVELKPAIERMAGGGNGGMDEATRTHIRNMDLCLSRLLEENRIGREETVSQLRSEIKLLARTVAAKDDS